MSNTPKPIPYGLAWALRILRQCASARAALNCRHWPSLLLAAVLLTWIWSPPVAPALGQQADAASLPNEYVVKAAFLHSFGRYIEWPEDTFRNESDPFVIGIVGKDSFCGALDEVAAKKTIQDRQIIVRRFASLGQYKQPCHILFVSRSLPQDQQTALIQKTRGTAMLLVGETPGFAERGGGANFVVDEDQVRFEINVATARQSRLRMDAKLLNLGKPVGSQRATASN